MKPTYINLLLLILSISLTACIREDEGYCPGVTIAVQDKNYDNISEIQGLTPIGENSPMLSYLSSLSAWIAKVGDPTAKTIQLPVQGQAQSYTIPSDFFAIGSYNFSALGSYLFTDQDATQFSFPLVLHPGGMEGYDSYLQSDQLDIPLATDRTISLKRTKGLLLIELSNTPLNVATVDVTIKGLYSEVDKNLALLNYYRKFII